MTTETNVELEKTRKIILAIRQRAMYFQIASWLSLLFIIASLSGSAVFFIYAGTISINDAEKLEKLKTTQLEEFINREEILYGQLRKLDVLLEEEVAKLNQEKSSIEKKDSSIFEEIRKQRDVYLMQLDRTRHEKNEITNTSKDTDNKSIFSQQFINTTITRVLIIFLLIFLVKILSSQHKYTIRMAAHFYSIADAIEIHDQINNHDNLNSLMQSMNTTNLNFSDTSDIPLGFVSELLSILKSKTP